MRYDTSTAVAFFFFFFTWPLILIATTRAPICPAACCWRFRPPLCCFGCKSHVARVAHRSLSRGIFPFGVRVSSIVHCSGVGRARLSRERQSLRGERPPVSLCAASWLAFVSSKVSWCVTNRRRARQGVVVRDKAQVDTHAFAYSRGNARTLETPSD